MTFRNKPIKNYQVSRPGPSSPDSSRFMGDHVLGIHDLGACRKGEGEKWISVCKNVSFCRCYLASNRSFLKLINFRESWKRGILSSETCERGCLLTSPSIFIHLPSARNPPRCSPSDEKGRDVSQPASLLQAGFPCWLQGSRSLLSTVTGWDGTGGMQLGGTPGKGGGEGEPLSSSAGQLYVEAILHSTDPIKSTHLGQLRKWDLYVSDLLQTFRHFCLVWQAPHSMLSSVGRSAVLLSGPLGDVNNSTPEEAVLGSITVSLAEGPPHGVLLPAWLWGDPRAPLRPSHTSALPSVR